jgi:tripartite-type tricarboxylate transporter receptor subunit TctC
MKANRKLLAVASLTAAATLLSAASPELSAQTFPTKPVTLLSPLAASNAYYLLLRQMADSIQAKTGRSIVFDVVLGADGTLAPARIKRSEPDGHTIALTWAAPLTLNPLIGKDQQYDPLKDFAYITMLTRHGTLFVAGTHFPASSVQELIAYAKSKPGAVRFGQAATGSRVGTFQLEEIAGVKFLDVPYKSSAQAEIALLGGEVDVIPTTVGTVLAQVKAGKMKPLFIGSKSRSQVMPDVPSISETYPNLEVVSWYALYAPAGTPADRIEWHHREWTTALKDPKIAERLQSGFGFEIVASSPAAVLDQVRRELPAHARVVKQHNIGQ